MDSPLISVVIPVYKVEDYLEECVSSVAGQTYQNLEIILVDDGSPDRCPEICDEWAEKDARIRVIHQKNAGLSAARNAGLDAASGDFLGFVDSDDYIRKDMYEIMLRAIFDTGMKIAYCAPYRDITQPLEENQKQSEKNRVLNTAEAVNALFYHDLNIAVWNKLFEKSLFENIRFPVGEVNEDVPITLPLIVKAGGVVNTGQTLYYYRPRESSITKMYHHHAKHIQQVYNNLEVVKEQLIQYELPCWKAYGFFAAYHAFSISLVLEKNRKNLCENVQKQYVLFRKLMWNHIWQYVWSRKSSIKNKILYCLVLTRLLRPIYKAMNKPLM